MSRRLRKELDRYFPLDANGVRCSIKGDGTTVEVLDPEPHDDAKRDARWRMEVNGPDGSPYEGARLALLIHFHHYPMEMPTVSVTGLVPAHLNIDPDGTIGCPCMRPCHFFCRACSEWSPAITTADLLPDQFKAMLSQPTSDPESALLTDYLNRPLVPLFQRFLNSLRQEEGTEYWIPGSDDPLVPKIPCVETDYWITCAASVGGCSLPGWCIATHASFPPVVRARVRAILLALRILERRAQQTGAPGIMWPQQSLPDDILHRIIEAVVRDMFIQTAVRRAVLLGASQPASIKAELVR